MYMRTAANQKGQGKLAIHLHVLMNGNHHFVKNLKFTAQFSKILQKIVLPKVQSKCGYSNPLSPSALLFFNKK